MRLVEFKSLINRRRFRVRFSFPLRRRKKRKKSARTRRGNDVPIRQKRDRMSISSRETVKKDFLIAQSDQGDRPSGSVRQDGGVVQRRFTFVDRGEAFRFRRRERVGGFPIPHDGIGVVPVRAPFVDRKTRPRLIAGYHVEARSGVDVALRHKFALEKRDQFVGALFLRARRVVRKSRKNCGDRAKTNP